MTTDKQMLAVETQFVDAFFDVIHGTVGVFFGGFVFLVRIPQGIELFDTADINHAVVEQLVQYRHVLDDEAAVLPDGVAGEDELVASTVLLEEVNGKCFGLAQGSGRGKHRIPQA